MPNTFRQVCWLSLFALETIAHYWKTKREWHVIYRALNNTAVDDNAWFHTIQMNDQRRRAKIKCDIRN